MNATWTYGDGRLQAHDETGRLLCWWQADAAMGEPLAQLFNHAHNLSQLILGHLPDTATMGKG